MGRPEERDEVVGEAVAGLPVPPHAHRFWAALDARLAAEAEAETEAGAGAATGAGAGGPVGDGARDLELGRAVGALAVPDHAPGFWAALEQRLAHEGAGGPRSWLATDPPAPAGPDGTVAVGAGAIGSGPVLPGGDEVAARRARRRPNRFGAAVTALSVAAAVALISFALVGRPDTPRTSQLASPGSSPDPVATAAVPATVETVTGEAVERVGSEVRRWELTLAADGSRREVSDDPVPIVRTYDAPATSGAFVNGDPATSGDVGRNLRYAPLGGPDDAIATFLPLDLAAHVTSRARAGDGAVEEVTFLGRPAWQLTLEYPALAGTDVVWQAEVVVDQETTLPLSVVEDRDGTSVAFTFTSFEVSTDPADRDQFGLELPVAHPDLDYDAGFERIDPAASGLVRPDPDVLPDGFVLDLATRSAGGDVTTVVYRRGFEQVVIRVGPDLDGQDPFTSHGAVGPGRAVELAGGAFAGPAELVVEPPTPPHVWASDGARVVTVSGPLSGDQLVALAASLGEG